MILIAFLLLQTNKFSVDSWKYLIINFIGASVLAVNAFIEQQWGFLLLEVVWALVSITALGKVFLRRKKQIV